jgi:hypothetical protein
MEFFCLIETEGCQVPHLEYLPVDSLDEARAKVRLLMREHRLPVSARIFAGNERLDTLMPCGTSTRQRGPWSSVIPDRCGLHSGDCPFPTPRVALRRGGGCGPWRQPKTGPGVRPSSRNGL